MATVAEVIELLSTMAPELRVVIEGGSVGLDGEVELSVDHDGLPVLILS